MGSRRFPNPVSEEGGGGEYRALLLRLLDNIEKDVAKLFSAQGETEKIARAAFVRVESVEDGLNQTKRDLHDNVSQLRTEIERVAAEAKTSTIDLVTIKATAKGAGYIAGAITGAVLGLLGTVLGQFILKALGLH